MVKEIRVSDIDLSPEQLHDLELDGGEVSGEVLQLLADMKIVAEVKEKNRLVDMPGGEPGEKVEYISPAERSRRHQATKRAVKRSAKPPVGKLSGRTEGYRKRKVYRKFNRPPGVQPDPIPDPTVPRQEFSRRKKYIPPSPPST